MDKETVAMARKDAEESYLIYANLKETYLIAEADWLKKSQQFREFDYQLALIDGRLKKISPASDKAKKEKKQPELTLEQLKSIAATLGVNITIEEPEEVSEEILELQEEDCPEGGDVKDDCKDCIYTRERHYDKELGECVSRGVLSSFND